MNRLQKKCLIVTAGFHLLLVLTVVFGSAFFSPRTPPDESQLLTMIPDTVMDTVLNSGKKNAQPPPPEPQPQPPQQPVVTPSPPPEPTKPVVIPPEPVKSAEPDPVKLTTHQIKVNTQLVTRVVPKNSTPQKAQDDERQQKIQQQRIKAIQDAVSNLKKNFTPATTVEEPSGEQQRVLCEL